MYFPRLTSHKITSQPIRQSSSLSPKIEKIVSPIFLVAQYRETLLLCLCTKAYYSPLNEAHDIKLLVDNLDNEPNSSDVGPNYKATIKVDSLVT